MKKDFSSKAKIDIQKKSLFSGNFGIGLVVFGIFNVVQRSRERE